jgi:signal transduction histidine kinase/FixJ family two-component response regulator
VPVCHPPAVLVPIVRERARILVPAIWACSVLLVAGSGPLGIQPGPWPYAIQWALVLLLGVLAYAQLTRRISHAYVQLASSASLWVPALITAVGMHATGLPIYGTLFIVEVASAGALLDRRLAFATIGGIVGLGVGLLTDTGGAYAGVYISVLLFAAVAAVIVHTQMSRALLRAEELRAVADEAAHELELRVEELQRAHDERARLQDQLLHSQRMEAVGTLAAGIAHDMNNVLASITGLGDLMLGELRDPRLRRDAEEILVQTERGAALTRSLLAFSRRGQYRKRPIRLWELVRGVLPMLERTLPKSIDIRCELDGDECVDADPTHLEQVLVNLALNAKDAMAGTGTLTLTGDVDDGHARLRVRDTGKGMDEATRLRAFEPFFTTKELGKGTGLGLSTVWGIVQAHGGSIAVDSRPGLGATFTILLPLSTARPTALARATTTQETPVLRGTVLIIDDEAAVRRTSKRLLERTGIAVITAENGADGLALFAANRDTIGTVVLDMGMPGMAGPECFARLREQSDVPVLIATGYAVDEEAQKLVAQGASLLEKPFSSEVFRREVARLLARHRRALDAATQPAVDAPSAQLAE